MKLIIGLGNDEPRYMGTRHNVGFAALDAFAHDAGAQWQLRDKFKAHLAEVVISGQKVLLLKPTTFYNLSGEAAQAVAHFYKIDPEDILVLHDELALPFGTLRIRLGGRDAGNNGIKSLIAHIGEGFHRMRIGISNAQLARYDAADFVLAQFTSAEKQKMPQIIEHCADSIRDFAADSIIHRTIVKGE